MAYGDAGTGLVGAVIAIGIVAPTAARMGGCNSIPAVSCREFRRIEEETGDLRDDRGVFALLALVAGTVMK